MYIFVVQADLELICKWSASLVGSGHQKNSGAHSNFDADPRNSEKLSHFPSQGIKSASMFSPFSIKTKEENTEIIASSSFSSPHSLVQFRFLYFPIRRLGPLIVWIDCLSHRPKHSDNETHAKKLKIRSDITTTGGEEGEGGKIGGEGGEGWGEQRRGGGGGERGRKCKPTSKEDLFMGFSLGETAGGVWQNSSLTGTRHTTGCHHQESFPYIPSSYFSDFSDVFLLWIFPSVSRCNSLFFVPEDCHIPNVYKPAFVRVNCFEGLTINDQFLHHISPVLDETNEMLQGCFR